MNHHRGNPAELKLGIGDYTCHWGVHIAGLYETTEERDEVLYGFLGEGVRAGDLQLYVPAEQTLDQFRSGMVRRVPEAARLLDDPAWFQTPAPENLYFPNGYFSPQEMDQIGEAFYSGTQAAGPRNIRASTEMVWAVNTVPGREHLLAYEARLNRFISPKPWVSICLYNLTKFDGATIMGVLRTHNYVISKGILSENPYYQDPEEWLREYAPDIA